MAANVASRITVKIITDASAAIAGMGKFEAGVKSWETKTRAAAEKGLLALGGLALATGLVIKKASDQQQAIGALESVFKGSAPAMEAWAKAQQQIGLSTGQAAQQAAYLGSMLKGSGMSTEAASEQTKKLIGLAADLAATYGGTTADAVQALAATMRGEYDPIERFGVSIKQSEINAVLAAKGQDKLTGAAAKSAEQAAKLELIWNRTKDAQGQSAREADTAAARFERLKATTSNLAADIGTILLPTFEKFAGIAQDLVEKMSAHPQLFISIGAAIAGVAVAAIAVNAALRATLFVVQAVKTVTLVFRTVTMTTSMVMWAYRGSITASTVALRAQKIATTSLGAITGLFTKGIKAARTANLAFSASMLANPVVLAIVAIAAAVAALVAVFVVLYNKSEAFRTVADEAWATIKDTITSVVAIVRPAVEECFGQIQKVITDVSAAVMPIFREHWPKIKQAILDVAAAAGEFYKKWVSGVVKFLAVVLPPVLKGAITIIGWFAQYVSIVIRAVSSVIETAWNFIKTVLESSIVQGAIKFAVAYFTVLWDIVKTIFTGIWSAVQFAWTLIQTILQSDIVQAAIKFAVAYFTVLWNIIQAVFTGIAAAVRAAWTLIQTILNSSVVQGAIAGFQNLLNVGKTVFGGIVSAIQAAWKTIEKIIGWISDAYNGAKKTAESVIKPISKAADDIKAAVKGPIEWVTKAFEAAWTTISNIWTKIQEIMGKAPKQAQKHFNAPAPAPQPDASGLAGSVGTWTDLAQAAFTSPTVTVNHTYHFDVHVEGALVDPEGAARAIKDTLNASDQRMGVSRPGIFAHA